MANSRGGFAREKMLLYLGILVIISQIVIEVMIPDNFRGEFLLAGLALCGVSYAQSKDKQNRNKDD